MPSQSPFRTTSSKSDLKLGRKGGQTRQSGELSIPRSARSECGSLRGHHLKRSIHDCLHDFFASEDEVFCAHLPKLDSSKTLVTFPGLKHNADEMSGVLGTELLHDVRSVKFDGTRADAEYPTSFFTGGAYKDLCQHETFFPCQRLMARKCLRRNGDLRCSWKCRCRWRDARSCALHWLLHWSHSDSCQKASVVQ
jgi:hypothetical protein